jgi:cytoskeletal protein CcmA (bactofilin family)
MPHVDRPHSLALLTRGSLVVFVVATVLVGAAAAASAQSPSEATPPARPPGASTTDADDLVMLSGTALVPRGQAAGEVVVFHGRAVVSGVAFGDVVVLDGPITISGQVSGSVIAINGPIRVASSASIRGDVLGGETVTVAEGATIEGEVRESVAFTPEGSLSVLGDLVGPLALACSVLVLGLALLALMPRGADRVATAARSAPLTSFAWGLALWIVLPLLGAALSATLVALPVGLALLLAMGLVFLVGATWAVWSVGRALVRDPRSRWLAFFAGWAIAVAVSLVPYLNVAAWVLAAVFGSGAMTVATWRARGTGGRHRAGYVEPDTSGPTTPEPMAPA